MDELQAAAGVAISLKPLAELSKSLMDALGSGKVREQAVKLYGEILAAQDSALTAQRAQATLADRIKALEAELVRLKKWNADKGRYKLADVSSPGAGAAFAYVYKPTDSSSEPEHWLCVKCFDHGQRGLLQFAGRMPDDNGQCRYVCQICTSAIRVSYRRWPGNGSQVTPYEPPEEPLRVILPD